MYKKFIPLLIIALLLSSCAPMSNKRSENTVQASVNAINYPLSPSEDAGQEYIDSFIFLGESTTYHLKSRGVLSGGKDTLQVWAPKSGTLMLDPSIGSCRIVYPESGEEIDIGEAVKRKKPKYMLLTFGLNGATGFIHKGKDSFIYCYERLTETIISASPDTKIILQSCFPVAQNMDMSGYSIDASTLNGYIDTLNTWTMELAQKHSFAYLNTCEVLKDSNGALLEVYQSGDGYHLSREAYLKILEYVRCHAYLKEITK